MSTLLTAVLEEDQTLRLTVAELLAVSLSESEAELVEQSLLESSIRDLWSKAIRAFPHTRRRQHVVDRVKTEEVKWQAFPGMQVLLASSKVLGERYDDGRKPAQRKYRTHLMFRDVKFSESPRKGLLRLRVRGSSPTIPKGEVYFEQLSFNDSVRVRCNCPDFRWRFNWECESEEPTALFGPKAPPYKPAHPERYRGPANPSGLAGICKHAMNLALSLYKSGAIKMR